MELYCFWNVEEKTLIKKWNDANNPKLIIKKLEAERRMINKKIAKLRKVQQSQSIKRKDLK